MNIHSTCKRQNNASFCYKMDKIRLRFLSVFAFSSSQNVSKGSKIMLEHCWGRKNEYMSKRIRHMYIVPLASCIWKAPAWTYIYPELCYNATMTNLRLIIWHLIILLLTLLVISIIFVWDMKKRKRRGLIMNKSTFEWMKKWICVGYFSHLEEVYLQTTNSRQNKLSMRENRNVLFAQIKRFVVSQNKTNDNALWDNVLLYHHSFSYNLKIGR